MTGHPTDFLWLVPALPLAGFLVNGTLALARPAAKRAVSVVGVGVLAGAFAVAAWIVAGMGHGEAALEIVRYWSWMPVGDLAVDLASRSAGLRHSDFSHSRECIRKVALMIESGKTGPCVKRRSKQFAILTL